MGSTRTALICQLRSSDLVVMIAYPTATIWSKKNEIAQKHIKTPIHPDPKQHS
jgi:hypothetical protein